MPDPANGRSLPDRSWREGESLGQYFDRIQRETHHATVVAPLEAERDRLRAEVEHLRAGVSEASLVAVDKPKRRESADQGARYGLQAAEESLADYPAIVAMHEEQTERAEAERDRLRAENDLLNTTVATLDEALIRIVRTSGDAEKVLDIARAARARLPLPYPVFGSPLASDEIQAGGDS